MYGGFSSQLMTQLRVHSPRIHGTQLASPSNPGRYHGIALLCLPNQALTLRGTEEIVHQEDFWLAPGADVGNPGIQYNLI